MLSRIDFVMILA